MKQISLNQLCARHAPRKIRRFPAPLRACRYAVMLALAFLLGGTSASLAGEERATEAATETTTKTAGSSIGRILICVRQQSPFDGYGGGYGPEHCMALGSLASVNGASVNGATGFGPAASWVGSNPLPLQATALHRLRNDYARQEFAAFDLERTARARAPFAIWLLSYNIKDLASTLPEPPEYWTALELQRYRSIGLTALDPGIERNPTGLKALGLRVSLPY